MSTPTLDDAIAAAQVLNHNQPCEQSAVVVAFLVKLKSYAEPLILEYDYDGLVLEGAMQMGFEVIDDDIELYVVSGAKLIEYVKRQRGAA